MAATTGNAGDVADNRGIGGAGGNVAAQTTATAGTGGLARFTAAGITGAPQP